MSTININDIDILIPLYIDHLDRIDNYNNIIKILKKYDIKNIFVQEHYLDNPKANSLFLDYVNYSHKKIQTDFFNKMECVNDIVKMSHNKYVAVYDVDVVVVKKDLEESISKFNEGYDFVYPYNGTFLDVHKNDIKNFLENGEIDINRCNVLHRNSCGGCVIFKREVFINGGMCNPNFKNVGYDDDELKGRFLKLNYKMARTSNPIFHLNHERTHTSYGISQYEMHNKKEFDRIMNMTNSELNFEILKWKNL